ncbi:MAG: peptidyl-prolyl cis-trans isomerase [Acidobacteriota bacterium]
MNVLKTMRTMGSLKILLWVLVFAFIAAMFTMWGGGLEAERGASMFGPEFAVKVGEDSLPPGVFQLQYRFYTEQMKRMLGDNFNDNFLKGAPQRVADGMADQIILAQLARKYGLHVGDKEVAEAIQRMYQFQDPATEYPETLARMGISASEFEAVMRNELVVEKLRNFLTDASYVSHEELKRRFVEENEKVNAMLALVPSAKFLQLVPVPSEAELKAYFETRKKELEAPEKRSMEFVQVSEASIRRAIRIDDARLKEYYQGHLAQFSTPANQRRASHILIRSSEGEPPSKRAEARKQAEEVLSKVRAGGDFVVLARQFSEDTSNAGQGGDLGWFPRERMVPAFSAAVFDQAKTVGEVLGPVETAFGYHVIRLTGIGGGAKPFDEVKEQVRQAMILGDPAYQKQTKTLLEEARKALSEAAGEAGVKAAAAKFSLEVIKIEKPFAKKDTMGALGRDPKLSEAVFKAEAGKWSEEVKVRDTFVRFKVLKVEPPHPAAFEEVRQDLERQWKDEQAFEHAKTKAYQLRAGASSASALESEAKAAGLSAQASGLINAKGSLPGVGFDAQLNGALMKASVGDVVGPVKTKFAYVVGMVTERQAADMAAFEKQRPDFDRTQRREAATQFLDDYLEARRKELEAEKAIEFNTSLIQKLDPADRS